MTAIELQHKAQLMTGSDEVSDMQTTGWEDSEDKLDLSDQGGDSSILDR